MQCLQVLLSLRPYIHPFFVKAFVSLTFFAITLRLGTRVFKSAGALNGGQTNAQQADGHEGKEEVVTVAGLAFF